MADAKGYHAYSGIARILKAYTMQLAVDNWGSVPYSNALLGNSGNLKPAFDNDRKLYDTIAKLTTDGIAQLSNSDRGVLTPSDDDAVYGGKAGLWIKFAHAIRARLFLHQSKGSTAMAASALGEINQSFTSNADNAQYVFGNTETSANPWYQFNEQRTDISFNNATMVDVMTILKDPRLPILIDTANDALLYYGVINAPVEFITYDELLFAGAEATLRNGGTTAAANVLYQKAIKNNMQKLGVKDADIDTYIAFIESLTLTNDVDQSIKLIATQEYFALYLNPEAWTLWRRTNSPTLTPVTSAGVPRRLLYPQSEYSYNKANTPASVTLYSPRIFWDN
ncbi:SusD/RagB family nutrient-binding outer membrane lipoprotein [Puia sp. P3]|uniref:SusD/RagB family nutrient-binding outer membrane lipoprotein n=1 Tax=Puia sp. P3 TaxID=3423952 RepID=UPI003D675A03